MAIVDDIAHQCAMDVDCLGVTCDVSPQTVSDIPDIPVSLRISSCTDEMILMLENKKWQRSLASTLPGTSLNRHIYNKSIVGRGFKKKRPFFQYCITLGLSYFPSCQVNLDLFSSLGFLGAYRIDSCRLHLRRQNFQTTSSLKSLSRMKPNYMWPIQGWGTKVCL